MNLAGVWAATCSIDLPPRQLVASKQAVVQCMDLAADHRLDPGRELPSAALSLQEYGLARGTVRSAIRVLRERGLVTTAPQRGTYVNRSAD